ncbi:MAG: hypothetical protein ABI653_00805 [Bacteroidota bacterium]
MKKHVLFVIILMISFSGFSQISFEPGYIINKNGDKIECLIKNLEWKNNPKEFTYKLSETSQELTGNLQNVKAFFTGDSKYVFFNTDIDRSSDVLSEGTTDKEPQYKNETFFLKALVEGKASLYVYTGETITRYFYTVDGSNAMQLIYKKYMIAGHEPEYGTNTKYRQQLWENLNYPSLTMKEIENTDYNSGDLMKIVTAYNSANNSENISYKQVVPKSLFHIGLRAGPRFAGASLVSSSSYNQPAQVGPIDFGNKTGIRVGVSIELVLPFDKSKWSLFLDPNYQAYSSEVKYKGYNVSMKFNFVEIPIGVRHYFFLNDKSKIFANAMYSFGAGNKSPIVFEDPNINNLSSEYKGAASLGAGFKFDKISAEFRYTFKQNFTEGYLYYTSDFHSFSFILGYDIF